MRIGGWVNVDQHRPVPPFFIEQFSSPIIELPGPSLVYNPQTNALDLKTTIKGILKNTVVYKNSIRQLRMAIEQHHPDIVVNFFELLGGLTYARYKLKAPMVCIAHQCLGLHPNFPYPTGKLLDRLLFKILIKINSWGAKQRFGLSFDEQSDVPEKRLRIMPPLLRKEVTYRNRFNDEDFVVSYTTQPGLQSEVVNTCLQNPAVNVKYFQPQTDRFSTPVGQLEFIPIDGQLYLDKMQHCRAVMTTAGFESVCEAMYLGKPVQMRPMDNHFEQTCNALDGQRVGAGEAVAKFDVRKLLIYTNQYDMSVSERFHEWYNKGTPRFIQALQDVIKQANKES
ncbi:glycosyltransferase family protein [Spirosoma flavus]